MKNGQKKNTLLKFDELSVFCKQLSMMLQAGIGFETGVSLLREDSGTSRLGELLQQIQAKLMEGAPLCKSLEETGAFPDYMLHTVEIGEASGRLEQTLSSLGDYYQQEADNNRAMRRAILYPAVMAVLIAAVFLVLITRVLPVFQRVFDQVGVSLSPAARGLLRFGQAGKTIAIVLIVIMLICAVALLLMFRRESSAADLRIFSHSRAGIAVSRSRFASAMSMMLASGLPIDEAMERASGLLSNSPLAAQLAECRRRMQEEGANFEDVASSLFSPLQSGLMAAGFRAGVSDRAMAELAERCRVEADDALSSLLTRFEYAMIIILCASVGFVLLSVMLPMLGVLSSIGG